MTRGGARKGAGRPAGEPHATRSIRLPVALWEALEAAADSHGENVNALVRQAVQLWVAMDDAEPKNNRPTERSQ